MSQDLLTEQERRIARALLREYFEHEEVGIVVRALMRLAPEPKAAAPKIRDLPAIWKAQGVECAECADELSGALRAISIEATAKAVYEATSEAASHIPWHARTERFQAVCRKQVRAVLDLAGVKFFSAVKP